MLSIAFVVALLQAYLAQAWSFQEQWPIWGQRTPDGSERLRASMPACRVLGRSMQVVLRGEAEYDAVKSEYYALQQGSLMPCCWIFPESAEDVAHALRVLQANNAPFAIKSGGHAILTGASNIEDGVTIDLSKLSHTVIPSPKEIEVEDESLVKVGPGARWAQLYTDLLETGLAVAGGRLGDVGVGGYLLGGGLNWYSNRVGWGCDNVLSYTLVLSNGTIVTANGTNNVELFWALKGGSNQFGVVTEFTIRAWKQPKVLIGVTSFEFEHTQSVLEGLEEYNERAQEDLDAFGFLSVVIVRLGDGMKSFVNFIEVNGNSNTSSPVFDKINSVPILHDDRKINSPVEFSLFADEPRGYNQWEASLTLHNRADVMMAIVEIVKQRTIEAAGDFDERAFVALTFQPLTTSHLSHTENAFGIDPEGGPLLCHFLQVRWPDASRSIFYERLARSIFDDIEEVIKRTGAAHPFVYINYAAAHQDVYASYGKKNLERLRKIRDEVDPTGVFARLMPGGMKL